MNNKSSSFLEKEMVKVFSSAVKVHVYGRHTLDEEDSYSMKQSYIHMIPTCMHDCIHFVLQDGTPNVPGRKRARLIPEGM